MLTLNNLSSPKGAHRNIKRIGRGQGSGQGTQAGKGHKGQKARSGGGTRPGFEGGALPMYMRLPKRGFSNARFKKQYAVLNLGQIAQKFTDGEVSRSTLIEKGMLKGSDRKKLLKILGQGEFAVSGLTFVGIDKFSATATEIISKAGSKVQ